MRKQIARALFIAAAAAATGASAHAQGAPFQTPGMPNYGPPASVQSTGSGQTDRFFSGYNPAIGLALDSYARWLETDADADGDGEDDGGARLAFRTFELVGSSWVDPNAWAYAVLAAGEETDGAVELEEAALVYTGLPGTATVKAGRYFVDFGKQMQLHAHELRTFQRPLPLATYLGDELAGDGVQLDHWFAATDEVPVRWSLGVFQSLLGEEAADDGLTDAESKDLDELGLTARLTGFADAGERGILQAGASLLWIPDFSASDGVGTLDSLDRRVWGADLTYGWTSDTGLEKWTAGAEFLLDTGDVGTDDSSGSLAAIDDDAAGWFAFVEWAPDANDAFVAQLGAAELPEPGLPDATQVDVAWTHRLSEYHRLRLQASFVELDGGDDEMLFALQYTGIVGPHGHGVSW
jgi:hypothetical protein